VHALAHFVATLALAAVAVAALARVAAPLGLVDEPGGRKEHERAVPLVGGLAIFIVLLVATLALGTAPRAAYLLLALSIVVAVGLWDDVTELSPRLKFVIQIAASAIMIWGAGIELRSVGDLLGWRPIGLSILAVPLTIFAVVGVVNSVNMIDGLDGLAGSIALVALAWYAMVAAASGLDLQFQVAVLLGGAIAGFLIFNLRLPWQPHARVFLGDAGSLMIGFALAWYAVDLTQGPGRTFPPIAALWIVLLPLADCVSLMARRVAARRSPFDADRHHIHHYLLARGLGAGQTLAILVALSAAFGAVGYAGWRLGLPEAALFWPFFFAFFAYHAWIQRAWRRLEAGKAAASRGLLAAGDEEVRALG
jgi:UDP-GlcNAc:undecaprenyl-phosphate GlcNAc-1-phosphate transferase